MLSVLISFLCGVTFSSAVEDGWIAILTLGGSTNTYNGESIDIGANTLNAMCHNSAEYIIKRECNSCNDAHKEIYYKRKTNVASFNVYNVLKQWTSMNNILGIDFNLYSTLQDALTDTKPWIFCNYDDNEAGAFRDCGPSNNNHLNAIPSFQFTADKSGKPAKFSLYYCWIPGLTLGGSTNTYNGEHIDIGADSFNDAFHKSPNNIIKRECNSCDNDYKEIYYKRTTYLSTFDVYNNLKQWTSSINKLGVDFNLYSTFIDALTDQNPWKFCNYDDNAVGAFRDCAPLTPSSWQFTADKSGKPTQFSIPCDLTKDRGTILEERIKALENTILYSHTGNYVIGDNKKVKNWVDAQAWCKGIGTSLATIITAQDVINFNIVYTSSILFGERVWTGFNDRETEGVFKWVSGAICADTDVNKCISDDLWYQGNNNGLNYDCGFWYGYKDTNTKIVKTGMRMDECVDELIFICDAPIGTPNNGEISMLLPAEYTLVLFVIVLLIYIVSMVYNIIQQNKINNEPKYQTDLYI